MKTHLRYRIERTNNIGTLRIVRDGEEINLPAVGEVLTLQNSELTGEFKVLAIDGPFNTSVDQDSYAVKLSRL